eukprot:gene16263-34060_t
MAFSPAFKKLRDAVDGFAQVVFVRQEHDAEMLVVGVVEAGALHQHHARLLQQFQEHLLVVLDRVHLRIEFGKHVERGRRLDASHAGNGGDQLVSEVALAAQGWFAATQGDRRCVCMIDPAHDASFRVAAKRGYKRYRSADYQGGSVTLLERLPA